jgi:tripartite-type tricarboxylate transporter receptor subunit TctC
LGLVLPGGAPPELVGKLSQALLKVLRNPVVKESFSRLGSDTRESSPAEYAEFIRSEMARTARIVKEAKITRE